MIQEKLGIESTTEQNTDRLSEEVRRLLQKDEFERREEAAVARGEEKRPAGEFRRAPCWKGRGKRGNSSQANAKEQSCGVDFRPPQPSSRENRQNDPAPAAAARAS